MMRATKSIKTVCSITVLLLLTLFGNSRLLCSLSPVELIKNGNFSQGNTGFVTSYALAHTAYTDIKQPGYYMLTSNPNECYLTFGQIASHSVSDTLMLLENGSLNANAICWSQTIHGIPKNTDFELSFWYAAIVMLNPAKMEVRINGQAFPGSTVQFPDDSCIWHQFTVKWNSGNADSAQIDLINTNLSYFGNDFVLDDISFKQECSFELNLTKYYEICRGDSSKVINKVANGSAPFNFKWEPAQGLSDPTAAEPIFFPDKTTRYYLTATDEAACTFIDSIDVTVNEKTHAKITAGNNGTLCPCDSIILTAEGGSDFLWDNGSTSQSIVVNSTGKYGVTVSNKSKCPSYIDTLITALNVQPKIFIDTAHTKIGDTLTVYLKVRNDSTLNTCSNLKNKFNAEISFNSTILTPVLSTPHGVKSSSNHNNEILNLSGNINDSVVYKLTFFVTLGNDSTASINIDKFSLGCSEISPVIQNGDVIIDDICKYPVARTFDADTPLSIINTPNPANLSTKFQISTPESGRHKILLFNSYGQLVDVIFDQSINPGLITFDYNTSLLSNGVYYYSFSTPDYSITKKLIIIK